MEIENWGRLVRAHLERFPEARAQDLYKLIYQGVMGAEHAAGDPHAMLVRLKREMDGLEPDAAEPLLEPVHPEGRILRVNLRPFKAAGGSPEALNRCFLLTARAVSPSPEKLAEVLRRVHQTDLGNKRKASQLRWFVANMARQQYPALSHSDSYRQRYRPAYRVILVDYVEQLQLPAPKPLHHVP